MPRSRSRPPRSGGCPTESPQRRRRAHDRLARQSSLMLPSRQSVEIGKINGNAATSVAVQELKLNVFGLGGTSTLLLDDNGKSTTTNERGDAVFYFPGANAIIAIEVKV